MWLTILIVLALGIIIGNIFLLRDSKSFKLPKDFKKRPDSDYDVDDDDDWGRIDKSTKGKGSNESDSTNKNNK